MHISLNPHILHIYGALNINFYGFFIALGIVLCMILIRYNKRYLQLHLTNTFPDIILVSILAGIIGGRIIEIISEPTLYYSPWINWFFIWEGGFSSLGALIGVITVTPFYIIKKKIPLLPLFDLVAIYAPLMQAVARIGCFFAGCCHGIPTSSIFGVIYTHPESIAYSTIPVHPTQLYSSFILLCIFLFMFFFAQHYVKKPGLLFCIYIMCITMERFVIDFLRADHNALYHFSLSFHQMIALVLFITANVLATILYTKKTK